MEGQDLPCTYLAHEPESINIVTSMIVIMITSITATVVVISSTSILFSGNILLALY